MVEVPLGQCYDLAGFDKDAKFYGRVDSEVFSEHKVVRLVKR